MFVVEKKQIPKEAEESQSSPNLILDIGSWTKCGWSDKDEPSSITPSIVACYPPDSECYGNPGPFIGESAIHESSKTPSLQFTFPIECGLPIIFEDAELLLEHIFDGLRTETVGKDIVILLKSLFPQNMKVQLGELMFEKFRFRRISFMNSDITSLATTGRVTGLLVDMGSSILITPIIEGCPQFHAITRLELGGRDITESLHQLLETNSRGLLKFRSAAEIEVVRQIKEQSCIISPENKDLTTLQEIYSKNEQCYSLPDGQELRIGYERVRATEILFHPELAGISDSNGLSQKIYDSIQRCDMHLRRTMAENIILCGGCSMIPGLKERLENDLSNLLPESTRIEVTQTNERRFSSWFGAATLSNLDRVKWIEKIDFEERGSEVFTRISKM